MTTTKPEKAKKHFNVTLDADVYDELAYYSKDMGLTKGNLVRILVNKFLREKKSEWYRPRGY